MIMTRLLLPQLKEVTTQSSQEADQDLGLGDVCVVCRQPESEHAEWILPKNLVGRLDRDFEHAVCRHEAVVVRVPFVTSEDPGSDLVFARILERSEPLITMQRESVESTIESVCDSDVRYDLRERLNMTRSA